MNQYDNQDFFDTYAQMSRSQFGLEGAGEWHQLKPLFPDLKGKTVLDLDCGYGCHCKYAIKRGANSSLQRLGKKRKNISVGTIQSLIHRYPKQRIGKNVM